jgi:plasminogen activator
MQRAILLVCFTGITCQSAYANDTSSTLYSDGRMNVSIGLGKMATEAHEYVIWPELNNYKLSELIWETHSAEIVKADITYVANNWLTIGLRGWTTFSNGNGVMDDYDWENFFRPDEWTKWSHHPYTRQKYANEADLYGTLWVLQQPAYQVGLVAGYQVTKHSWTSYGGHFIYTDPFTGTSIFDMPDSVAAIGFKQTIKTPYLGLTAKLRYGKFSASVLTKYSQWGKVHADDEHYQRPFYSRSDQKGGNYRSVTLNLAYDITSHTSLFTEATYSDYKVSMGNNLMYYYKTGQTTFTNADTIGSSNRSRSLVIGLRHAF